MTGGTKSAALFVVIVVAIFTHTRACTPVVIWCPPDYDAACRTAPSSPLQKLTSEEFEGRMAQFNITEPVIVVEELCAEDLRNNKVLSDITNGSRMCYMPCVKTPDMVFQKNDKQIRTIGNINDDHEFNMALKDVDSSGCIALTGKQCRYSHTERIKRDVADSNATEFKIKTDKVLLYSAQPLLLRVSKASDKSEPVKLDQSKVSAASSRADKDEKNVTLTISFSNVESIGTVKLEFLFQVKNVGYYTLSQVTSYLGNNVNKEDLSTRRDISFPFGFSYHCTPQTIFAKGTISLTITEMQVQVDHRNATFSDAYDCVGFTSIPIWTGIFVTAILGLIMIWALTMIMDIRTMDRFDDPKGKTITISSAE